MRQDGNTDRLVSRDTMASQVQLTSDNQNHASCRDRIAKKAPIHGGVVVNAARVCVVGETIGLGRKQNEEEEEEEKKWGQLKGGGIERGVL